jgi:hypothetical protein
MCRRTTGWVLSPSVSSVGYSPKLHRNLARHDASWLCGSEQHRGGEASPGQFGHADQELLHLTLLISLRDLSLLLLVVIRVLLLLALIEVY